MTYKSILAYFSHTEGAGAVADVAVGLAEKFDAQLTGLHIVPRVPHHGVPRHPIPNDMLTTARKRLQAEAEEMEKTFADATKSMKGTSEWQLQKAKNYDLIAHILNNIISTDLVITSQEIAHPLDGVPDPASKLVLGSGRPIVIVPELDKFQTVGNRIIVGWKSGREASRAVFDALPLLQKARSVHVVSVDEGNQETEGVSQICAALARHGVNTMQAVAPNIGAGEALLGQVEELKGDLLVMGCYGRLRLSELIFGGATRHVLKHMAVPVLMSH